jgi:hypothetical protein
MRLANAMVSLPAAMFVDVQQRHTFQLQRYTLFLDDDYQVLPMPEPLWGFEQPSPPRQRLTNMQAAAADIKKQRVENTAALKPSLSNPNAKAELDDLDSRWRSNGR